ncbi:MAG: CPBP family intramembrane metalloprotease, partial [Candidatus Heimdallarchaeota archaeon]
MINEVDESIREEKTEPMIQRMDLLYPFAFILLMLSVFDLSGTIAVFALVTALIAEIFVITSDADITLINLLVNLIAQISSIAIFLVFHQSKRVEPEEKDIPLGNHWLTTYLVYSLILVVTFLTAFIDSFLESLGLPEKSPYEAIEPTLDLIDNPLFYILFFGTLVFGAAIWEELVFRRAFIPFLERRGMGTFWVLLVSSLLFSLMHTPTDLLSGSIRFAIIHFFNTFTGGFALGFLYMRTRKIIWPIILHGVINGVAGVGMVGIVRYEEFGDITLITLGGYWILIALIVGAGTAIYLVFQMIRYRSLIDQPVWYRILSDFNIRPARLTPIMLIALGFIAVEGGVPLVLDFFFGLFG